ncbi:hypothetical protein [Jannaschia pohangensis]|uniref:Uncharacterized protein n=1 Tax=Jannaschia pohangensis TaxID=390807 RepID=A0A1I3GH25_9RHOB|nr:hypothetical protein [Jannaschia pohangensis]SFI22776.1 hypothetical protein SAMN04488095_0194 [Jannaschia pohangensis]
MASFADDGRPAFDVPFWQGLIEAESCSPDTLVDALRDPQGRRQCRTGARRCFEASALTLARMCGAGPEAIPASPCAARFEASKGDGLACLINRGYAVPHPVIAAQVTPEMLNSPGGAILLTMGGGRMDVAPAQLNLSPADLADETDDKVFPAHHRAVLARITALLDAMPRPREIRKYDGMSLPDRRRIMSAIEASIPRVVNGCPIETGGRSAFAAILDTPEVKAEMEDLVEALALLARALNGEEVTVPERAETPKAEPRCQSRPQDTVYPRIVETIGFAFGMMERQR